MKSSFNHAVKTDLQAMPSTPTAPYFSYNPKRHAIELSENVETRLSVSQLTLVADMDAEWVTFDAAGAVWSFRYERPPGGFSFLTRLLTKTILNPVREVAVIWTHLRSYEFSELRDAYLDAVKHDDDVLTQFVEPPDLQRRIEQSRCFHDLVETWKWMETDSTHATEMV